MLHRRKTSVTVFEDLDEDGESVLDALMERLQAPDSDEESARVTFSTRMFGDVVRKKDREPPTQAPRYVLVIDGYIHALRTADGGHSAQKAPPSRNQGPH
jgi:hypothetical protein